MVYMSYFGNRSINKDFLKVSIAAMKPRGTYLEKISELAPSSNLLYNYKQGKVSIEQYVKIYNKELTEDRLEKAIDILIKLHKQYNDDIILLCYEKLANGDDFCHRKLAMERLNNNIKFIDYFKQPIREY